MVIAASGMCAGGRVVNYLKAMLGAPRHHVLFVGYQAEGTPGRDIQRHGPNGGYSAHADQQDLLRFVRQMKRPPAPYAWCTAARPPDAPWPRP